MAITPPPTAYKPSVVKRQSIMTGVALRACSNATAVAKLVKSTGYWCNKATGKETIPDQYPAKYFSRFRLDAKLVESLLNGERRQSSRTSQFVFGVDTLISFISQVMTLEPGDLIATGTPSGVGTSKGLMKPGDVYEVTIEGIGTLRNRIVGVHGEVA